MIILGEKVDVLDVNNFFIMRSKELITQRYRVETIHSVDIMPDYAYEVWDIEGKILKKVST